MFASQWRMGKDPDALAIRRTVFVQELGMPEDEVFDSADDYAAQLLVELDGVPVATARLSPEGADVRLDFVAVLPAYRRQGFGDLCVRQALYKAQLMGARVLTRVAERHCAYFQAFGFLPEGPEGEEIGLAVGGANIVWHSPCKKER